MSGEPRPILLRVKGVVTRKPRPLKELYPERYSSLGFRRRIEDFGTISQNGITRGSIDFANISSQPVSVTFTNISPGLRIKTIQDKIPSNTKGEILFEIDTRSNDKWGVTRYTATPAVNGISTGKELVIQTIIREDFSKMSKEEIEASPLPMADKSSHNFGTIKAGTTVNAWFDIKNFGRRQLLIRKVDVNDSAVKVEYPSSIDAGKNGRISVSVNTTQQNGSKLYTLTVITNSPSRPAINFVISGDIKK